MYIRYRLIELVNIYDYVIIDLASFYIQLTSLNLKPFTLRSVYFRAALADEKVQRCHLYFIFVKMV